MLVEHQTQPDKMMPYRLWRYMLRIIDQHLHQHRSKTLPVVFPLVFYSGNKPYPYSTDIFSLFGNHTEWAKQAFLKPFTLIDLTQIPDEELQKLTWVGIMALLLKPMPKQGFMHVFKKLIPLFKYLYQEDADFYIAGSFTYIYENHIADCKEYDTINMDDIPTSLGETMMSLAQELRQQGECLGLDKGKLLCMEEGERLGIKKGERLGIKKGERLGIKKGKLLGMEEGEIKAQQKIARNMLAQYIDPNLVSKITGLSLDAIEALGTLSLEEA